MIAPDEIDKRIAKWVKYALVGNPQEPDYGDDRPQGYIAASLESQYKSPPMWHAPEPKDDALKDDYDLIEPIWRGYQPRDRMTIWYYASHRAAVVRRDCEDVWNGFRQKVGQV